MLLALAGAALGLPLAYLGLDAIIAIVPPGTIPDESFIAINRPVLWFTLALSVVTAVLFGMAPAWHSSKTELLESLKSGGRSASSSRRQAALRDGLVVASAAAARLMQQLVFKVSPFDPLSFAAVAGVLLLVGWSASLWPALRASRLDPVRALRHD